MQKFLAPFCSIIAIIISAGSFFFYSQLNKKVEGLNVSEAVIERAAPAQETVADSCGEACKKEIERAVTGAIATISATPKSVVQKTASVSQNQTVYIPLGGPVSTTSTQWVDVPGVEVYIDKVNDYSSKAVVTWEASLKVKDGNGQAFARLQDITHGISVDGSEISTLNNASAQTVFSGNLSLWAGKNLYRLQLKSLNSYEVTLLSGRIKVSY